MYGCVKLRKIYEINYKILLKLSTEHNIKEERTYYFILKLTGGHFTNWIINKIIQLVQNFIL